MINTAFFGIMGMDFKYIFAGRYNDYFSKVSATN